MKLRFIVLLTIAITTPLVCAPRAKNNHRDPYWDIKELATKRENRGKAPRGRSSKTLRTQCGLIRGISVAKALRFLEPKDDKDDDVSTN